MRVDTPDVSLLKGADHPGMALKAMFLGCLEYTLEEGTWWGRLDDGSIWTTAFITGLSGLLFVWRSLTFERPVVLDISNSLCDMRRQECEGRRM